MKQSVEITNDQVSISSVKDVFKFGGKEQKKKAPEKFLNSPMIGVPRTAIQKDANIRKFFGPLKIEPPKKMIEPIFEDSPVKLGQILEEEKVEDPPSKID